MFQLLPVKSVNNVHLVCRNLHQIGNLYRNQKLSLNQDSPKHLESLYKSTRTFKDLAFEDGSDHLWRPEKFELLEGLISFTGTQIKTLTIRRMKVDPLILQKLLNLLPNLESLELGEIKCRSVGEGSIKWDLKSTKIKCFKMIGCTDLENLLEFLEKCAIRELELHSCPEKDSEVLQKFLKSQEKNLKRLTIIRTECNFPVGLTDLRLEHFGYGHDGQGHISFEFLKQIGDLSSLTLYMVGLTDEFFETILELTNLESLLLRPLKNESSGLENLYRLGKLKRLLVNGAVSRNILDHLRFGVYNNLEELDAWFRGASLESVQEMMQLTPKLKKIVINFGSPQTINAMLDTLENLEILEISTQSVLQLSQKVYPKIKQFSVNDLNFNFNAEQFTQQFPNLEALEFNMRYVEMESFFATLLSGLKQLKTVVMRMWSDADVDHETVLQWFLRYGKHLEEAKIVFGSIGDLDMKNRNSFCIRKGFLV